MNILQLLIRDLWREKQNERLEQESSHYFSPQVLIQLKNIPACQNKIDSPAQKQIPDCPLTMEEADRAGLLDTSDVAEAQYFTDACQIAKAFCSKYALTCEQKGQFLYITTNEGKWYFCPHLNKKTTLYHKNYETRRNRPESYHVQFIKTISTEEILHYIRKHDLRKETRKTRVS